MESATAVNEECRQLGEAAQLLATLKHRKFDKKTLLALDKLKKRLLGGEDKHEPSSRKRPRVSNAQKDPTFNPSTTANAGKSLPGNWQILTRDQILKEIEDFNPPRIPPFPALNGLIGDICSPPFEKQLTVSDIRDDQSRLTLNKAFVKENLLPLVRKDNGEEDVSKGINVITYDINGKEFKMQFKAWAVDKVYVLTAGWKAFKYEHELKQHEDFVTVWMFRNCQTDKLCFVIAHRNLPLFEQVKSIKKLKR